MKNKKSIKIDENISLKLGYGVLEFYYKNLLKYKLDKDIKQNTYSIFDVKREVITFFVPDWNRKKLIQKYIDILTNK